MYDLFINSAIQYTLLLFVPLAFAIVLKWAKVRCFAMIGGIVGGILLGPTVLGAVSPAYWEGLFQGGVSEHEQIVLLERQQQTDILAATSLGVEDGVVMQMRAQQQYEVEQAEQIWSTATWKDQRTLRTYTILLITLILLSGSLRSSIKGSAPPLVSLSVGVWAVIIPSGSIALLAYHYWGVSIPIALAIGSCLGVGPWTLATWEQRAANNSEANGSLLMVRCGRIAWLVASAIALYATWQVQGAMAFVWLLPVVLLPAIWILSARNWRWLWVFVDYAAIPSVMATALVLVHPVEHFQFWPTLFVVLLCADARWLGGIIGLGILGGRKTNNAMRLAIPLVDAGVSQMCMATLLFGAAILTEPFLLALLAGAVFLEFTVPLRQSFATNKSLQDAPTM